MGQLPTTQHNGMNLEYRQSNVKYTKEYTQACRKEGRGSKCMNPKMSLEKTVWGLEIRCSGFIPFLHELALIIYYFFYYGSQGKLCKYLHE